MASILGRVFFSPVHQSCPNCHFHSPGVPDSLLITMETVHLYSFVYDIKYLAVRQVDQITDSMTCQLTKRRSN